ncbi:sugar-transfer associated ATP-grasp domain-containing protein [Nitrosospira briensis]|uniref:sugar-transfer associated ATP-grasp domain-containing protein n=1 Tax=Nitrosospira briensis TaxID=35799 RepID=UPI00046A3275|nr:sugar-transfer associated ATP-grasp domain-containing protein [Nitrosospira briensis]
MKIINSFSIDRITRDLSGAMWILARLPEDNSAATAIHRCFQREVWREIRPRDRLVACMALPFVPFVVAALVMVFTTLNGGAIKKRTGKGIIRQIREQVDLAARFAILSPWYYIFELHDDDKRKHAGEYLNRLETKAGLYLFLRDHNGGLSIPPERSTICIKDKARFMARCREFGIKTAPVLLSVEKGEVTAVDWNGPGLPEIDLFVKPLYGQGGKNATRWDYLGSGKYRRNDGEVATEDQVLEGLRKASWQNAFLVQPRLVNHHEIADLANGTLATVRVMSCRNEQGGFEVTNAVFRMARNSAVIVDNFHAGGIAANVDIHTGELGRGACGAWGATADGWYERHYETHAQILKRKLPCWPELIDLVQYAHGSAFSDQVVIGWDVALLDNGPCLIEANKAPDLDIIQRIGNGPVGNERLGKLLAFNLRRTVETKYARSEVC